MIKIIGFGCLLNLVVVDVIGKTPGRLGQNESPGILKHMGLAHMVSHEQIVVVFTFTFIDERVTGVQYRPQIAKRISQTSYLFLEGPEKILGIFGVFSISVYERAIVVVLRSGVGVHLAGSSVLALVLISY